MKNLRITLTSLCVAFVLTLSYCLFLIFALFFIVNMASRSGEVAFAVGKYLSGICLGLMFICLAFKIREFLLKKEAQKNTDVHQINSEECPACGNNLKVKKAATK